MLGTALAVGLTLTGCSGGSSGPTSSSPAATTASGAPASTTAQAGPSSSGPSASVPSPSPSPSPSGSRSSAGPSPSGESPAAPSLIPAVYCGLVTPGELAAYGITVPAAVATPVSGGGEGAHCAYGTQVTFDVVRSATEGAAHTAYQALAGRSGIAEGGAVSGADEARLGSAPGGHYGWVLRRGRLVMALALPASAASAQTAADGTAQATMLKSAVLH